MIKKTQKEALNEMYNRLSLISKINIYFYSLPIKISVKISKTLDKIIEIIDDLDYKQTKFFNRFT